LSTKKSTIEILGCFLGIGPRLGYLLEFIFEAILGNMGLMGIGLPIGMAIGIAVGTKWDKSHLKEEDKFD